LTALADGYHFAWLVGAAIVVVTVVLAMSTLRSWKSGSAEPEPVETEAVA
jgi:beta-lactamase regulating signal transducer with metallopeptidase domain